ncbi:MAG: IS66 family transposase [Longimicrobiales bacterium]
MRHNHKYIILVVMAAHNPTLDQDHGPRTGGPAFEQVREAAQAMVAEGRGDEAFDFLLSALAAVLKKSRELELLLAKLRRVGRSSERVDPQQLALLFNELTSQLGSQAGTPDPEAEAREDAELEHEIEQAREEAGDEQSGGSKTQRATWRTQGVKREVHTVTVPPENRRCERCGQEKHRIGQDVSHVLEYVPAHFVEHEYRLEKWACRSCKRGVTTAPGPAKVIDRSAAGASVLAHAVVSKYADHTPLHRLHRIYDRSGVHVPVSTLADWVARAADRLEPLVHRIASRILEEAHVVGTDATGLPVLDPSTAENIQRGTIWAYVGDGKDVVFRYTPTGEGATGPWQFLAGRRGYIQADAASVFDRLFNGQVASAVEVGCWAHARRRFVALQDTDCRVAYPIKLIGRLYRIEHLADLKELSAPERARLRGQRSRRALDTLHGWLVSTLAKEPPASALAKACSYTINQWAALTRFLEDGRLGLDNNLVERQLRDIALGRKNFLFAGSHAGGHRAAILYSLLRTAAQHGVPPLPYLTDVLQRLANGSGPNRLDELLPDRWEPEQIPP